MSKESAMQLATTGATNPTASPPPAESPVQEAQTPQSLASSQFAKLSKREAQIVKMQQEVKKEKEWLEGIKNRYNQWEVMKKTDPIAAIKDLGFSEQDLFNYLAANEKPELTPEDQMKTMASDIAMAKIKEYEEAQEKKVADAKAAQDTALIAGYKSEITKAIKTDPDKFEYCAYNGKDAEDLAFNLTEQLALESKGKEILTPIQALEEAEKYFEGEHMAMNGLKKYKAKVEPAVTSDPKAASVKEKTITPGFPHLEQPKAPITRSKTVLNTSQSKNMLTRKANETREEKKTRLIAALRANSYKG